MPKKFYASDKLALIARMATPDVELAEGQHMYHYCPAYSGGYLDVSTYPLPVIVNIENVILERDMNCFLMHKHDKPLGGIIEPKKTKKGGQWSITAKAIIGNTPASNEYFKLEDANVTFRPSIGLFRSNHFKETLIEDGETVDVNGRTLTGPCIVLDYGIISEISPATVGGDIEAKQVLIAQLNEGTKDMTFEEFLKSTKEMSQADFDGLSQEEQDAIRAEFDALEDEPAIEADGDSFVDDEAFYAWLASQDVTVEQYTEMSDDEKAALQAEYAASGQASSPVVTANLGKPTRKRAAPVSNSAESTRIVALQAMFGQHPDFLRDAIAKGWSTNNANAIFKARKGKQTMKRKALQANIGVGQSRGGIGRNQSDIMTAAFAKTFGLTEDNICKKMFNGDKTRTDAALTAAAGQFRMGCGYSDLILTALDSRDRKLTSDHLKAVAYQSSQNAVNRILKPALQASLGFSTVDATAIIDFTHQAFVEQEYESVEFIADTIAKVVEVEDTTKLEMYRSTILGRLQEIANSGEIKNLSFTVEKTEAHAKPMGGVFSLSEEYILNDSIGIFNGLMSDIAINAAQSYEDDVLAYVREMMAGDVLASDGQPFFSVARGNLLTGAASQLNTNGLSAALRAFRGARDLNGKPVSVSPKNLIIPPALEWIASVIYSSTETNAVDNNGNAQVYKGKFLPVTSPLLGTGNEGHVGLISDLAWLLAADPQRIPFVKALKVRGFSTPRVVSSTMDLSVWGTKYQVIYPYGVASGDTRGAVLMTGE